MNAPRPRSTARGQRGVYAIEFAMVFLIFFVLIYAAICYGLIFTLRFGLQNAAEDGARAALRYQIDLPTRAAQAQTVATASASWLPAAVTLNATATVCQVATNNCTAAVISACGITWATRCQMVVTVTASNMGRLLPPLPSFATPTQLTGQASMLLDTRTP
ncbi:TadE/TadG family type IV pilus assembly protein [Variovorax sp. EL159]|uniref:TadE/TadG family type IV pilus assembly protein n=1 Tax=Variovorax sp. EL159 TaxID=1566270 RepID=UPI00088C4895|nr:TadE/TadG family type IV pilus assembly protein [Variovorax sp. EL159]SCX74047.1 Flp pilus assembly protein TadG [Variovorax sp. EL159]